MTTTTLTSGLTRPFRGAGITAAAAAGLLAAWCLVALMFSRIGIVPYPWTLAAQIADDWSLLMLNTAATLEIALAGLVAAVAVIVPLACLCLVLPVSEPIILRVALVIHVIPFVAIAPILIVSLPTDVSRIVIAALQVYFPLLIGLLLGLRSTDQAALDVVTASGGRNAARLRFVRIASAVPQLIAGLQIAVPAAILGAVISEFFGADEGLGAIIVTSQQSFLIDRTWAIAMFIGALAAIGYGLVTLVARLVVPWAGRGGGVAANVAGTERSALGRTQATIAAVASFALLVGFWHSLRTVFDLPEFFTKTPWEIVTFLIHGNPLSGTPASAFWSTFFTGLGQTLLDAGVGFIVGTLIAVAIAVVFVAVPALGRAIMPFAVVVRSVPLLALTPLLMLMFGRGLFGVTVLVTLVTFFPTLVTVMTGLRSVPQGALDVIRASGGSSAHAARFVRMQYALPSITAAARIAVPNALTGATLAEWLATGKGLGQVLTQSSVLADYFTLWSAGVLLVVVALLAYSAISVLDRAVQTRLGVAA